MQAVRQTGEAEAQILPELHRYDVVDICWEQPHAVVYRALRKPDALPVIVKVPRNLQPRVAEEWLQRDYQIARLLQSPCAAKPLDLERNEWGWALVHADCGARPLDLQVPGAPLDIDAALTIMASIATAVEALHRERLIHANLNLKTIWVSGDSDAALISDFGCARHPGEQTVPACDELPDLRYVSPEQTGRTHRVMDQRTDIYSLGIVLFRLLAGKAPFDGTDPLEIIDGHLARPPVFPPGLETSLPTGLTKIVAKALEKGPEARYLTASGLVADLLECRSRCRDGGSFANFEPGRHDAKGVLRIPRRLYGRDQDTATLLDKARAVQCGRPAMLLVKGAAGVGKSAFVNQLEEFVRSHDGRVVFGKFDQYKRNLPYGALIQAFKQLISHCLGESIENVEAWRSRILAATGQSTGVVIEVVPDLALITGPQPAVPHLPPIQARNRFNRVFANLLQVFASPNQLLCVVMDDLQWVDSASLHLLEHVLTDLEMSNVLLVGAYRDNEVGPAHPLELTVRALIKSGVDVHVLHLRELKEADVVQLLRDTFERPADEVHELAQVLCCRTGGNALYLTQLLHFLCDDGFIAFEFATGRWVWDLARIQREGVTQDILGLFDARLSALDNDTRSLLATAACLGNSFDIEKLAVAAGRSLAEVRHSVAVGVKEGLIVAVEDRKAVSRSASASHNDGACRFSFLHDRIQQAAFDCIPNPDKKVVRLQIGRRLMASRGPNDDLVPQPDLLNNLNCAWELLGDEHERLRVARLNLVVGRHARQILAYSDALRYLSVGLNLLGDATWETYHDLASELHSEALECEYLTGNFERADRLFDVLIARSTSKVEKARIYLTKILLETSEERYEEAVRVGIEALRMFGVHYVRAPSSLNMAREFFLTRLRIRGRRPSDLIEASGIENPEKVAALRILVALFPTAYFLSPDLLMFTGLKVVNYSLRHGIMPVSAGGFVLYGLGLGAGRDDHKSGHEFGRFALELAEKSNNPSILCKVLVIYAQFIKFWRDPIDESFPAIDRARRMALEVGDHQYVNYAIIGGISLRFSRGGNLDELLRECDQHRPFVLHCKDAFPVEALTMWRNCVLALQGRTAAPYSLRNADYDETAAEQRYLRTGNLTLASYQYTLRLQLSYLFGRTEEAMALSDKGEAVIRSAPGYITVADHYLYRGMAAAALTGDAAQASRHCKTLRRCLDRLRHYASNCPQNFGQHEALLSGEAAWAEGQPARALKHYNHAIELAETQRFTQLGALANERAALCCLSDEQRRLAGWYFACSRAAYAEWGALAKVSWLDREYGSHYLPAASGTDKLLRPIADTGPIRRRTDSFDVATALEASRILATGGDSGRVLTHLMQVVRVQAGAERARLLVLEGRNLRLEASALADSGHVDLFPSSTTEASSALFSPAIVNYVIHTGDDLVLAEADADARFAQCGYVSERRPKSVVCAGLRHQGNLLGLIYLEHSRISGLFDDQKLEWLRILAAEVGLAVWSGRLSRYRDYVHRFAPTAVTTEIDANPESPDLAAKDCDISVLFADLAGYTRMAEQMESRQFDELVNRAFSRFVDEIHLYEGVLLGVRGDELFVMFHDEDPARHVWKAASAALAIGHAAARLNEERTGAELPLIVNMGMNSGVASVGLQPIEASSGARWRYDATGLMVNIAVRIRELARDGSIMMSEASAARVRDMFELEDAGEHALKNVKTPTRVFRLLGARNR